MNNAGVRGQQLAKYAKTKTHFHTVFGLWGLNYSFKSKSNHSSHSLLGVAHILSTRSDFTDKAKTAYL